jgi:hypothetical protein
MSSGQNTVTYRLARSSSGRTGLQRDRQVPDRDRRTTASAPVDRQVDVPRVAGRPAPVGRRIVADLLGQRDRDVLALRSHDRSSWSSGQPTAATSLRSRRSRSPASTAGDDPGSAVGPVVIRQPLSTSSNAAPATDARVGAPSASAPPPPVHQSTRSSGQNTVTYRLARSSSAARVCRVTDRCPTGTEGPRPRLPSMDRSTSSAFRAAQLV